MKRFLLALLLFTLPALPAWAVVDPALVKQLAAEDSDAKIAAIQQLGASGDRDALKVLKALANDTLMATPDGRVFLMPEDKAFDAATGAEIDPVPAEYDAITINNRIRSELDNAIAGLRLLNPDRTVRLAAARELQSGAGIELVPILDKALGKETDGEIKHLLRFALDQANLASPDAAVRLAAVKALGHDASPTTKGLLLPLTDPANETDATVRQAATASVKAIESRLAIGDTLGQIFTGLSLGSILLLAALGLAITYGVMGVINMAHGELLMVGAYAAYSMQGLFRSWLPAYADWYVVAAIPVSFMAAALVGMALERTVIRWLYGRPLETLLATWGLSLILIQAARVLFGAQNVEVGNPSLDVRRRGSDGRPGAALEPHRHHRLHPVRAGPGLGADAEDPPGPVRARRHPEPADGRLRRGADRAASTPWPSVSVPASPGWAASRCRRWPTWARTWARATSSIPSWWWCWAAWASWPAPCGRRWDWAC